MAFKLMFFACLVAATKAASVHHQHHKIPLIQHPMLPHAAHNSVLKPPCSLSQHGYLKNTPGVRSFENRLLEPLGREKPPRLQEKKTPEHQAEKKTPEHQADLSEVKVKISPGIQTSNRVSKLQGKTQVDTSLVIEDRLSRSKRDLSGLAAVPPGEVLSLKSLQNLASLLAGLIGLLFGPFGPAVSAVVTPFLSDIVYALAGFVN